MHQGAVVARIGQPTKILISGTVAVSLALLVGVYATRATAMQLARMEADPNCAPVERSAVPSVLGVVRAESAAPR
jgi:hypothetical protein